MTIENRADLPEVQDSEILPTLPNGQPIPRYTIVDQTSLDGNKIVDLADPAYGMDAVNLRTLHSKLNALELGVTVEQLQTLAAETPISALLLDANSETIHNAGEATLGTDLPNWAQVQALVATNAVTQTVGRSVALRTVYEGTLAQLQALGNTIAGATVYAGQGTTDLESCGVLLLSRDANGITLLPESGVYFLGQSGQYQRAIDFRAGASFEPGLTFWADAIDARYEVLDRGADVAGGFSLSIRLSPRPSEVSGEGVLHSRPTGEGSSAIRLDHSNRFIANNGVLDLAAAEQAAIDAVPGLQTAVSNTQSLLESLRIDVSNLDTEIVQTESQVAVQQGQINTLTQTDQTQQQAINALTESLSEIRIAFVDGAMTEIFDGLASLPLVSLLTTVGAKLAIYQISHNLNFRSVKMTLNRVVGSTAYSNLLPSEPAGELWLECQTGMQRLDANNAVVNVPLSGPYVLVLSRH